VFSIATTVTEMGILWSRVGYQHDQHEVEGAPPPVECSLCGEEVPTGEDHLTCSARVQVVATPDGAVWTNDCHCSCQLPATIHNPPAFQVTCQDCGATLRWDEVGAAHRGVCRAREVPRGSISHLIRVHCVGHLMT